MQSRKADDMFVVLFVCTGNICRSPVAEQLFRQQSADLADLIVAQSAGTRASVGRPMTGQAEELLRDYGTEPSQHIASDLTVEQVRRANLVLVASREHRAHVVSMVPRASRKTFTMREFERLLRTFADLEPDAAAQLRSNGAEGLDELVADVASMRGMSSVMPQAIDDDIVDPYRRSQAIYDEAGRLILESITETTSALRRGLNPRPVEQRDGPSKRVGRAPDPSVSRGE